MKITSALVLFGLVVVPLIASAEWVTVEMEGAKQSIHLDIAKGALYVGSDCTPLLYFSKKPQRRSKSFKQVGEYYAVQKVRSRSLKKSMLPSRTPTAIIIDGGSVKVLSESMVGRSEAKGKVRQRMLAGRKKVTNCK